jgi:hypothetical protein
MKPRVFTQLYIQIVFAVAHKDRLLGKDFRKDVFSYMSGIATNMKHYINSKNWLHNKFNWQEGYGSFSYSKSHIENVYKYILNQEEHHKKKKFREEYIEFLKKYEIEYDERFLFEFFNL